MLRMDKDSVILLILCFINCNFNEYLFHFYEIKGIRGCWGCQPWGFGPG